jgi:hypothetical protein
MKLSFNVKDIDWKQFFLQRGEWLGLGIALAITLPVFFIGAKKALFSGSAAANANEVSTLTNNAKQAIQRSTPLPGTDQAPADSNVVINFNPADPATFATGTEWFIPSSIEDTKRRKPDVLSPGDWLTASIRGGMKIILIHLRGNGLPPQVEVIKTKQAGEDPKIAARRKRYLDRLKKLGINPQQAGAAGPGAGIGGGFGGGRGGGMPGMQGGMGMMMQGRGGGGFGGLQGGQAGALAAQQQAKSNEIEYEDLDKLKDNQNLRLAQELLPGRLVMVAGSFPFKKQLEAFRVALRMRSLNDLLANLNKDDVQWKFTGLEIQRRVLNPDGSEKSPWEQHYEKPMLEILTRVLARAAYAEGKEDEEVRAWHNLNAGLINYGLVWPRPPLDEELGGKYPNLEIAPFKESVEKLTKLGTDSNVKAPSQLQQQILGKTVDPLDPLNPITGAEVAPAEEPAAKQPDADKKPDGKEDEELAIPDNALVRFFDLTVQPGFTYEYRVRVKMANPNYKQDKLVAYASLAKDKELFGDWVNVPPVTVPHDAYWYVLDDKPDRERALIQVHRWIDTLVVSRDRSIEMGDWSILEKTPAYRGEYLGRPTLTKVPQWDKKAEMYEIAKDPRTKQKARLPVDFSVREPGKQFPALLIDFQGGKGIQARIPNRVVSEDTPVQMLVLEPDGRLVLRSSLDDVTNGDRVGRVEAWKKRLEDIEKGIRGGTRAGPGQGLFDRSAMPGAKQQ